MKKIQFSTKKIILCILALLSFLLFLILNGIAQSKAGSLKEQCMAERWSDKKDVAQISCFFSQYACKDKDSILEFEHILDKALVEASIMNESENEGARMWADAYSTVGEITLSSDRSTLSASAIGVGGDFFLFHPLELVSGSYFSGDAVNKDYCMLDEDAAWQLFGSSNIAGQIVFYGNKPLVVAGVVKRPTGRMEEAAGLDSTLVYVSYEVLVPDTGYETDYDPVQGQRGQGGGINHYEIVMPNPVAGFALKMVQEKIGGDPGEMEILENTSRFSLLSRLKLLLETGTRSMNGKAIIYPYWENIARGYEDLLAIMTIFILLFLLYPVIFIIVVFIHWWRHKGFTLGQVARGLKDKAERRMERRRIKRWKKHKKVKNLEEGEWLEWL